MRKLFLTMLFCIYDSRSDKHFVCTLGASACVSAWLLGPRLGRWQLDEAPPMGSPTNALIGLYMLWWGWLAFNAGSTFGVNMSTLKQCIHLHPAVVSGDGEQVAAERPGLLHHPHGQRGGRLGGPGPELPHARQEAGGEAGAGVLSVMIMLVFISRCSLSSTASWAPWLASPEAALCSTSTGSA